MRVWIISSFKIEVTNKQQLKRKKKRFYFYSPMNSPFSRERSGQKEARMLCTGDANFREHIRVKYPLESVAMLK